MKFSLLQWKEELLELKLCFTGRIITFGYTRESQVLLHNYYKVLTNDILFQIKRFQGQK